MLRTPLLPYEVFGNWATGVSAAEATDVRLEDALERDRALLRSRLQAIVSNSAVADAIFVASPSLYEDLPLWRDAPDSKRGKKIERALVRYVSRMAARSTPFGLFAGVSAGRVGETTNLCIGPRTEYERHTRLDNDYLFALAAALGRDRGLRTELRYWPNTSLYSAFGRLRYTQARLDGTLRSYHLVAVRPTNYLLRILDCAADGATPGTLAAALVDDDPDIELAEAEAFIHELIDSQILVSNLGPAVTGDEPIHGMLEALARVASAHAAKRTLAATRAAIEALDAAGIGAPAQDYREIATTLETLPTEVRLSRLFQVDMIKPSASATLGDAVIAEIERGIDVLGALGHQQSGDSLVRFREAFSARYGDREVLLSEALDEEDGIGFESVTGPGADASPLLAGLSFPFRDSPLEFVWDDRWLHLQRRLHEVLARGDTELRLTVTDIRRMRSERPATQPDAFSCMATVLASSIESIDRGDFRVLLSAPTGPSGARLSGRFCHASERLRIGVLQHLRAEEALQPDVVFAEIVHLPEGRTGNILCRPVLREYEIPYLGISGARRDKQLSLDDLVLSVRGGRIVLRSRSLGREVLPRLTTAHNFRRRSLSCYRFLCALQSQDVDAFSWRWGPLAQAPFLPRVTCGQLVFAPATWTLTQAELQPLARGSKSSGARTRQFAGVQQLRRRRNLPRWIVVVDGDNALPVDLENALSVDSFVQLVKGRPGCVVREALPSADELCAHGPEGAFAHELVVSFVRKREAVTSQPSRRSYHRVARRLAPGSNCLYAKLYTGPATADEVLRRFVLPEATKAVASGLATHWFFVRYADPDWHLRVRLFGDPDTLYTVLAPQLLRAAQPLLDENAVWKLQLDTYERELERYGGAGGIELAERLFAADSVAVAGIVALLEGDAGTEARWRLALRGTDMLLDDFGLSLEQKRDLMRDARFRLGSEFDVDARFGKQLGERWRKERPALLPLLARDPVIDAAHALQSGFELFDRRSATIRSIIRELIEREAAGELTLSISDTAWSYVHMHNNRLLRSAQRAQELVMYDMLKRYYEEQVARG